MKVVVTGATGNVGTSTVQALSESQKIDEIVGLARREPTWRPPKTRWVEANVLTSDLAAVFEGADAVIHLAWAIQPSRDAVTLERINVEGSRRVFEAVAAAKVPKLIHASSVGAYSRGPKDREVDEGWPTDGTPTSFYSRHKVAVERVLDRFESDNPDVRVVRLRPALIFKDEAATEIRRLFIGPFLPNFLLRRRLLPALPRVDRLCFQAVHSEDVGQAYLQAVLADVDGAFNIAAEPPLSPEKMAERVGVRSFPVPARVVRRLADLSWKMRLQPTPPGWLDMALRVPLMSSARARKELGWKPRHSAVEALEELIEGLREGQGANTPPLRANSVGARLDDLKTGVGARQWDRNRDEQIVKYLADLHSIELQALAQLRAAPSIAGDERLCQTFEQHLAETEGQERRVRERLEALGGEPSKLKDAAGAAGGWGMVAFAATQPDTPGKLAMHAYSYEHMELAAYELLKRLAERAGDEQTARMAADIAAEEERMAKRLEQSFDTAVEVSLAAVAADQLNSALLAYLRDVHALEGQAEKLLEAGAGRVGDEYLEAAFRDHLDETQRHLERIEGLLEERGARPSLVKDAMLKTGGLNLSAFFGAQPDPTTKLAGFAFAFEHLEIAAYELLTRVAERVGDEGVATAAEEILAEERRAAERVAESWNRPESPSEWRRERAKRREGKPDGIWTDEATGSGHRRLQRHRLRVGESLRGGRLRSPDRGRGRRADDRA
jgi:ferritin-like metal-binding protein YciE/nucleoside-diphosphate-sugar epimerase